MISQKTKLRHKLPCYFQTAVNLSRDITTKTRLSGPMSKKITLLIGSVSMFKIQSNFVSSYSPIVSTALLAGMVSIPLFQKI